MAPAAIVRNAGPFECYHITRHYIGHDSCVIVAVQYHSSNSQLLERPILFTALRTVVSRHAALGVRLAGESNQRPAFSRLQKIDLSQIVQFLDDDEAALPRVMKREFLHRFDTESDLPLWRLIVLKDNTVIFSWHHGIGDGKSGLAFHSALFHALHDLQHDYSNVDDFQSFAVPTTTALSPPVEAATDVSPSLTKIIQEFYNLLMPTSWTSGFSSWTGNPVSMIPDLTVHVELIDISSEDYNLLLKLCKANGASITSTLHALAISALSRVITPQSNTNGEMLKNISSFIPISLRGITNTSADVFCDYVSTYHSYPSIDPVFSWSAAAEYAGILRAHINQSREELGMLKYLFGKYEAFFKGKLGNKRAGGLEISNIGLFEPALKNAAPNWTIGRVYFAQCDAVSGSAIKMNVVGVPGGISITVTWSPEAVDDDFVRSFVAAFKEVYDQVLRENTP